MSPSIASIRREKFYKNLRFQVKLNKNRRKSKTYVQRYRIKMSKMIVNNL